MAWHRIDYDGIWSSDKLSRCSDEAQADYAWLYGISDAWGCFELTNMRVILGRVSPIRKKLTLERLEADFVEFQHNGLCFTWVLGAKRFGYWTGCESRLPAPSIRNRYSRSTPEPPREDLERYVCSFGSAPPESSLDPIATTSRLDRDNVTERNVTETGTNPSAPRPAAESAGPAPELPFDTSQKPALYSSHDRRYPPFLDHAIEEFRIHYGQEPTWRRRDYRALDGLLGNRRDLSLDELGRRWANYLQSTEPYISSQGASLEFFCRNFDRFIQGPQIATPRQGGIGHAEKRTANNLRNAGFKVVG
jgi:hypothetical protein